MTQDDNNAAARSAPCRCRRAPSQRERIREGRLTWPLATAVAAAPALIAATPAAASVAATAVAADGPRGRWQPLLPPPLLPPIATLSSLAASVGAGCRCTRRHCTRCCCCRRRRFLPPPAVAAPAAASLAAYAVPAGVPRGRWKPLRPPPLLPPIATLSPPPASAVTDSRCLRTFPIGRRSARRRWPPRPASLSSPGPPGPASAACDFPRRNAAAGAPTAASDPSHRRRRLVRSTLLPWPAFAAPDVGGRSPRDAACRRRRCRCSPPLQMLLRC